MFTLINNAIIQVVIGLTLSVPGLLGLLQGTSLDQIEAKYEQALNQRGRILKDIERLESKHQRLSARIAELKRDDVSRLTIRLALEDLLRQSQELSRELEGLHNQIRGVDNTLSGQRTQLVGGIDRQMEKLEKSLASAKASDRKGIVSELNGLRAQRRSYATPLPSTPSSGEVNDALSLAGQAETPEELLAAADEIEDTEDQIRRRLDAIGTRLDDLKQSQRLLRRARTFSKEERFFEETDRDRVIARYSRTKVTQSDTNRANSDGAENASGGQAADVDSANNAASDDFDSNLAFSPSNEGAREFDEPAAAPSEPAYDPGPQNDNVFDTVEETVVINSNDDAQRAIGANGQVRRTGSLQTQIQTLESEQKRLKRQADALKRRAKDLRSKADSL